MSDARWNDPREYDARDLGDELPRVYDTRDRDEQDPRDSLTRDLDLPRGDERELVVDRDRVYELDGEDSRALAAVGAFRIMPEHDLDLPHDTLESLHDQRLVELVDLGGGDRGLTLTAEARDLLDSHSLEREASLRERGSVDQKRHLSDGEAGGGSGSRKADVCRRCGRLREAMDRP